MEIIFALMLLGATPVGAAMLNKPTRNRFVKYLQVHIVNPAKGIAGDPDDPELEIVKKRSDEYWKADGMLQLVWQEAFNWWVIPNREAVLKGSLAKYNAFLESIKPLNDNIASMRESQEDDWGWVSDWEIKAIHKAEDRVKELTEQYRKSLTPEEKTVLTLFEKYGKEIYYGNDLIRISAQDKLPALDFIALTRYTSK